MGEGVSVVVVGKMVGRDLGGCRWRVKVRVLEGYVRGKGWSWLGRTRDEDSVRAAGL